MTETVLVAILSLAGTLGGSVLGILASNKLTIYRIQQLEKKVEEHNNLVARMYEIEKQEAILGEEVEQLKKYHN